MLSTLNFQEGRLHKVIVLAVVVIPFLATGVAIWQLWERYVTWLDMALLVGLYVPISLGVTAGFHRMLTHRSFTAHPIVRFVILVFGSMAIEGQAITWASDHLKHHALSDKPGDPHSPVEGLLHSHLGWLFGSRRMPTAKRTAARSAKTRSSSSSIARFCCGSCSAW